MRTAIDFREGKGGGGSRLIESRCEKKKMHRLPAEKLGGHWPECSRGGDFFFF